MKRPLIATALIAALATAAPAVAGGVHGGYGHGHQHGYANQQGHQYRNVRVISATVTISCFRGPWEEVIWDRPEPVFVDSLVGIGYTYPEAHAIGERVCRDSPGVGNPENIRSTMLNIIESEPPRWQQ